MNDGENVYTILQGGGRHDSHTPEKTTRNCSCRIRISGMHDCYLDGLQPVSFATPKRPQSDHQGFFGNPPPANLLSVLDVRRMPLQAQHMQLLFIEDK